MCCVGVGIIGRGEALGSYQDGIDYGPIEWPIADHTEQVTKCNRSLSNESRKGSCNYSMMGASEDSGLEEGE